MKVKSLSHVRLFVTPWTVAHQAPLSMEFSRQEYWSVLPFPSPMRACRLSRFSRVQLCATLRESFLRQVDKSIGPQGERGLEFSRRKKGQTFFPSTFFTTTTSKLLQSCPTLYDPIDGSPPGSPIPGILQARTLEWVAISFSSFPLKLEEVRVQYTQAKSYLTLCDLMDCSPPGSSVHGIL